MAVFYIEVSCIPKFSCDVFFKSYLFNLLCFVHNDNITETKGFDLSHFATVRKYIFIHSIVVKYGHVVVKF